MWGTEDKCWQEEIKPGLQTLNILQEDFLNRIQGWLCGGWGHHLKKSDSQRTLCLLTRIHYSIGTWWVYKRHTTTSPLGRVPVYLRWPLPAWPILSCLSESILHPAETSSDSLAQGGASLEFALSRTPVLFSCGYLFTCHYVGNISRAGPLFYPLRPPPRPALCQVHRRCSVNLWFDWQPGS